MTAVTHSTQLCTAPALLNWVEFWMELQEEKNGKAMFLAACVECGFNSDKIGLVEKEVAATAVNVILRTLEVLALCVEAGLLEKSPLHEDYSHTLENTHLQVPFREVQRLWSAIW